MHQAELLIAPDGFPIGVGVLVCAPDEQVGEQKKQKKPLPFVCEWVNADLYHKAL